METAFWCGPNHPICITHLAVKFESQFRGRGKMESLCSAVQIDLCTSSIQSDRGSGYSNLDPDLNGGNLNYEILERRLLLRWRLRFALRIEDPSVDSLPFNVLCQLIWIARQRQQWLPLATRRWNVRGAAIQRNSFDAAVRILVMAWSSCWDNSVCLGSSHNLELIHIYKM